MARRDKVKLKIEIEMDNAAFEDGNGYEVARILNQLREDIDTPDLYEGDGGTLRDINGNKVGFWKVTEE